jgi:hypothetical protein
MADPIETQAAVLEQAFLNVRELLARIDARLDRTEARMDRIEMRMERLEARQGDDLRFMIRLQITLTTLTITLMLAGFATLGGMMVHGFRWL